MASTRALSFEDGPSQAILECSLLTIHQLTERLQQIDRELAAMALQEP